MNKIMDNELRINIWDNSPQRKSRWNFFESTLRHFEQYISNNVSERNFSVKVRIDDDRDTCKPDEYILELTYCHGYTAWSLPPSQRIMFIGMPGFSRVIGGRELKFTKQTTVEEYNAFIDKFLLSVNLKNAIKKDNN